MRYFGLTAALFSLNILAMNNENGIPIIDQSSSPEEWRAFAKAGCAYYPILEQLKPYMPSTLQLASSLNSAYDGQPGYSQEKNQQIELL